MPIHFSLRESFLNFQFGLLLQQINMYMSRKLFFQCNGLLIVIFGMTTFIKTQQMV